MGPFHIRVLSKASDEINKDVEVSQKPRKAAPIKRKNPGDRSPRGWADELSRVCGNDPKLLRKDERPPIRHRRNS